MFYMRETYEERLIPLHDAGHGSRGQAVNHAEVCLGVIAATASLYGAWSIISFLITRCIG